MPSLVAAYYEHVIPLPARDLILPIDEPPPPVLTTTQETPAPAVKPSGAKDLSSIVIISNPSWPTSGQQNSREDREDGSRKRASTSSSSGSQANDAILPLKRPKIKRDFVNLVTK